MLLTAQEEVELVHALGGIWAMKFNARKFIIKCQWQRKPPIGRWHPAFLSSSNRGSLKSTVATRYLPQPPRSLHLNLTGTSWNLATTIPTRTSCVSQNLKGVMEIVTDQRLCSIPRECGESNRANDGSKPYRRVNKWHPGVIYFCVQIKDDTLLSGVKRFVL